MSLIQLSKNIYALDLGVTIIGVLLGPQGATLIDSGMNKSHCKKIEKELDRPVCSIIHTHYHADHTGGSAYFCEKRSAKVYMPVKELSFALTPALKSALLFGGMPPMVYQKPFLKAEQFDVSPLPSSLFVENSFMISAVNTCGHSAGHTSYMIDGVFFAGDALTSPQVIDKHTVLYMFEPSAAFDSLENMRHLDFDTAVVCHKDIMDKSKLILYADNQKIHMEQMQHEILCAVKRNTAEEITNMLMRKLDMLISAESFLLTASSVKGYLSRLESEGLVKTEFNEQEGLIWIRS